MKYDIVYVHSNYSEDEATVVYIDGVYSDYCDGIVDELVRAFKLDCTEHNVKKRVHEKYPEKLEDILKWTKVE